MTICGTCLPIPRDITLWHPKHGTEGRVLSNLSPTSLPTVASLCTRHIFFFSRLSRWMIWTAMGRTRRTSIQNAILAVPFFKFYSNNFFTILLYIQLFILYVIKLLICFCGWNVLQDRRVRNLWNTIDLDKDGQVRFWTVSKLTYFDGVIVSILSCCIFFFWFFCFLWLHSKKVTFVEFLQWVPLYMNEDMWNGKIKRKDVFGF